MGTEQTPRTRAGFVFVYTTLYTDHMISPPTILVIFGVTGDLVKRKLVPALWSLRRAGKLPERFRVVGFSRRDFTTPKLYAYLSAILAPHGLKRSRERNAFLSLFSFVRGQFEIVQDYHTLASALSEIDMRWGMCSNKLFYLAAPPALYQQILESLASSELNRACGPGGGWLRIIVEKPFGADLETAKNLDLMLGNFFEEAQVYRIDHYLAKEMLQNILLFRFANNLFEENWSRETVEKIAIKVWERSGVEDRGDFYDTIGALRDVGQNHLLQMLSLVAMERPENLSAISVHERRAEILKKLRVPSARSIERDTIRGQYRGYGSIPGVRPGSQTETYFKIRAWLDAPRWRGVSISLESGKRIGEQRKEIEVVFRHPVPCFCPPASGMHYKNRVVFALEPEERITIYFWSKKPGFAIEMEERRFEFLLRDQTKKTQYVEEYQKLLLDCIAGDQMLFVSTEEVKAMWRFIDPIVRSWEGGVAPLRRYGPDAMEVSQWDFTESVAARSLVVRKEIGLVGFGKMGMNIALRLRDHGWRVTGFDLDPAVRELAGKNGIETALSLRELVEKLSRPRLVWLMVAAGPALDKILFTRSGLIGNLAAGDAVVDGGNSFYQDSMRRAKKLRRAGIHFLDVGVSGGPEGARKGTCLMIGGERRIFQKYEQLFRDLAADQGYRYIGVSGAGHFVKMVHNGIEYGMMQSIAEGFDVLGSASWKLNVRDIADLYNHGSVIESRLLEWLRRAYERYGEKLAGVSGSVAHTGEAEWMVKTAKRLRVPTPVIKEAFSFRIHSQQHPSQSGKILSALRGQFGGHSIVSRKRKAR